MLAGRVQSAGNRNHISPYLQKLPHSKLLHTKVPHTSASDNKQYQRRNERQYSHRHHNLSHRRSASANRSRSELLDVAHQSSNLDHLDLSALYASSIFSVKQTAKTSQIRTYDNTLMMFASFF
jgi:hypothetical protein